MSVHQKELDAAGGHGVARAYAYHALATALGAEARLTQGTTRSTSGQPVTVEITASADAGFTRLEELWEQVSKAAEDFAARRRSEIRKEQKQAQAAGSAPANSYDITRATRAAIEGFAQGVAGEIRTGDAVRPAPVQAATRARAVDERTLRAARHAGREYARKHVLAAAPPEAISA
jgi:hypothetical protein